jgi:hypothetical protein
MDMPAAQVLRLPIEGVLALETVLGIMTDNGVPVDHDIGVSLVEKLYWAASQATPDDTTTNKSPGVEPHDNVALELTIHEADTLLRGLAYTEAMSVDLPWYPMVIDTVHYVGDELLGLWPAETWMQLRSAQ